MRCDEVKLLYYEKAYADALSFKAQQEALSSREPSLKPNMNDLELIAKIVLF